MIEVTKTIYQAEDGKQFLLKHECITYEAEKESRKKIIEKYNDICEYCRDNCDEEVDDYYGHSVCINDCCPFHTEGEEYNCIFQCIPYQDFPDLER